MKRMLKGRFTVEAAVYIPMMLFVIYISMKASIQLYTEIRETHEEQKLEELWLVDDFYRFQILKEVTND